MTQTTGRKKKTLTSVAFIVILLLWFSAVANDQFSGYLPSDHTSTVVGNTGFIESSIEQVDGGDSSGTVDGEDLTETVLYPKYPVSYDNLTGTWYTLEHVADHNTTSMEDSSTQMESNDSVVDNNQTETSTNNSEETDSYDFKLLPPSNAGFNVGRTIPVKFQLMDNAGNCVTTATATILVDSVPGTSSGASNVGNLFRLADDLYIFNLNTTGMSTGLHVISVELDGGSIYNFTVELI